jgi:glycosyltransferase involved in cell wall biosynthesis
MNILFIHQNFPGQFVHLAAHLAGNPRHKVVALSIYKNGVPDGVTLRTYTMLREAVPDTHPLIKDLEAKVLRAEACAAAAMQLKRDGFVPDLIVAHPGWGETLFMKDIFPKARLAIYCEYYYASEGQDVGFDPETPALSLQHRYQLRLRNTVNLHSLDAADCAYAPTQWQRSTFPQWAHPKIQVIHDGIDLARLQHRPGANITLAANAHRPVLGLKVGDEVLTYVARNLEPVRGFQVLMRALPEVLRRRPKAHAIIVGGDEVSYGAQAPGGLTWKDHMLKEVGSTLDMARVHFVGKVPESVYLDLLSISKVHVYWTTPFVLSWSFLEAAASGVPVIASATQPVLEFSPMLGVTTVDFFDVERFAREITVALGLRSQKRKLTELPDLSLDHCIHEQMQLLGIPKERSPRAKRALLTPSMP